MKNTYKNYSELPLTLSVPEVAAALGISRAGAYELVRSDSFPQDQNWEPHSCAKG